MYKLASCAVCEPKPSHFHVDVDAYVNSMIDAGQMRMTIACHKAAKKVIMEYMEEKLGKHMVECTME